MTKQLSLILGGARSGKSSFAEAAARASGGSVLYVATAEALDDEIAERIARHRSERPATWTTLEAPRNVGEAIAFALSDGDYDLILVDCLTFLISNVLLALPESARQTDVNAAALEEVRSLLNLYQSTLSSMLVVSNEVGMGIVPPTHLGRFYRDALGWVNQQVAREADNVVLLVAGVPWYLKGEQGILSR